MRDGGDALFTTDDAAAGATARVLVVEDEQHIVETLVGALRDEGYDAHGVCDGAAAIAAVRQKQPDLILLDLMMPGYSGWDFLELYRQTPGPHVPVLVITAAADSSLLGIRSSVEEVIRKPYSLDHVLGLVRAHTGYPPPDRG